MDRKLEQLASLVQRGYSLLSSDDAAELQLVARSIRDAWVQANYPPGPAPTLVDELESRVETVKRRPFEERLRACPSCRGRQFRVSGEQPMDAVGLVRFAVCEGCGVMTMFWVDLDKISSWGPVVSVRDGSSGPYR